MTTQTTQSTQTTRNRDPLTGRFTSIPPDPSTPSHHTQSQLDFLDTMSEGNTTAGPSARTTGNPGPSSDHHDNNSDHNDPFHPDRFAASNLTYPPGHPNAPPPAGGGGGGEPPSGPPSGPPSLSSLGSTNPYSAASHTNTHYVMSLSDINKAFQNIDVLKGKDDWVMWKLRVETAISIIQQVHYKESGSGPGQTVRLACFSAIMGLIDNKIMIHYRNESDPIVLIAKLSEHFDPQTTVHESNNL
jgi:hypothetical protein